MVEGMDLPAAISRLPEVYATALHLHGENLSDQDIAERLGIAPEAVEALLCVASAKLQSIIAADENTPGRPIELGNPEIKDADPSNSLTPANDDSERESELDNPDGPAP